MVTLFLCQWQLSPQWPWHNKTSSRVRMCVYVCVFWVGFKCSPSAASTSLLQSLQPWTRSQACLLSSKALLSPQHDRWCTWMWHVCECNLYMSHQASPQLHTPPHTPRPYSLVLTGTAVTDEECFHEAECRQWLFEEKQITACAGHDGKNSCSHVQVVTWAFWTEKCCN